LTLFPAFVYLRLAALLPAPFSLTTVVVADRHASPNSLVRRLRGGFTLIEMLAVLMLLAVTLVLVSPAIPPRRPAAADAVQDLIDGARRAAVQRAETVTLSFTADGSWSVEAGQDAIRVAEGRVDWQPALPLRLRISPLGACTLHVAARTDVILTLDPVHCRLREGSQ
jgi:prepilin-type N-terminal cleavage/methylation domain-containing protein